MNQNPEMHRKYEIMLRVRTVRGVRTFVASPLICGLFGIAFAAYLFVIISLGDIVANTMIYADWHARLSYAFSSLMHSRAIVQTLASLIALAAAGALFNSIRKIPFNKIRITFGRTQQI